MQISLSHIGFQQLCFDNFLFIYFLIFIEVLYTETSTTLTTFY